MDNSTQPGVLEEANDPKPSSVVEISLEQKTRESLEAVAKIEGKTLSELVEAILAAGLAAPVEDHDVLSLGGEEEIADEWEKLTNEILRLESIRRKVFQLAGEPTDALSNPSEHLQRLGYAYDQRIRGCEEKLEKLMARCRKRSAVCGILVNSYDH